jgi:hypothetical protein
MHFETCTSLSLSELSLVFNDYAQNTGLFRSELEVKFQDFKRCEVKFAMFTAHIYFLC